MGHSTEYEHLGADVPNMTPPRVAIHSGTPRTGWQHDSTPAERGAATLLRSRGWSVSAPSCPACHGVGFVTTSGSWGEGESRGGFSGSMACANGCPPAVLTL